VSVLRSPSWMANDVDTGFLDRFAPPSCDVPTEHLVAAALASAASRDGVFPTGFRTAWSQPQWVSLDGHRVEYSVRRTGVSVSVDGASLDVRVWSSSAAAVDMSVAGVRRTYFVSLGDTVYVD